MNLRIMYALFSSRNVNLSLLGAAVKKCKLDMKNPKMTRAWNKKWEDHFIKFLYQWKHVIPNGKPTSWL